MLGLGVLLGLGVHVRGPGLLSVLLRLPLRHIDDLALWLRHLARRLRLRLRHLARHLRLRLRHRELLLRPAAGGAALPACYVNHDTRCC